jgi:hypothetical protein
MGIKLRHLSGYFLSSGSAVLAFILVSGTHPAIGIGIGPYWPPPSPPPPPQGRLQVIIDGPDNIKSSVQWNLTTQGGTSGLFNNGDTISMPIGAYNINFKPIKGWTMPDTQVVSVSADSTNTFLDSCHFTSLSDDYQGLFSEASDPKFESCGFFEVSGGKSSLFTGKISSAGSRYSFSGKFDETGSAWSTINRSEGSPLSIHLLVGEDTLTGEITDGTWTATILARRNTFHPRTNPPPHAGKYTFAFLGSTNSVNHTGGDSVGTMTVSRGASVVSAITFSDGTKASQSTFLGKDGRWPFYVPLYSGKGFAFGWLQSQCSGNCSLPDFGTVTWMKPVVASTKCYPAGFTNQMEAFVSPYQSRAHASVLLLSNGKFILQNGDPSQSITNGFTIDTT